MTTKFPQHTPSVTIRDSHPITTSVAVADFFGKQHKHVLEKIRNLECSPAFTTANFSAIVVTAQAGFDQREVDAYEMTKDGFVFLVMGFTGKRAAAFKEAYIAAFNRMERQLLTRQQGAYSTPKPQQLSDGEIKNLKWLIDSIVNPFRFRAAWNQGVWYALRQATGVPSPYPFTAADLPALARELQRIMEISHETRRLIQQLEKQVLQQMVRNRGELRPVLNHIQHEFRQLSLLGETRSQLNNVERQSLARLTRRAG
ncbi:Rha family transcriptional regulator [Edwardsiella piscicida]|uniref:Rha family transcriptional regulator n=1 Tax=Edwardsiella piscicida TaxID=1263550 RepID=UPI000D515DDF|nr:Rha family transcriptional regulator [Edwardsiella piscicida]UCQ45914.1 Rha family transcriptional regulator [Edwardsiella piscicida]